MTKLKLAIEFSNDAFKDYVFLQKADRKMLKKINKLIEEITRTPFTGTGKPEQLQHELSGFWSRRIDAKNRIVYRVLSDRIQIAMIMGHYD